MDETTRRQKLTIPEGRLRIVIDSDAKMKWTISLQLPGHSVPRNVFR